MMGTWEFTAAVCGVDGTDWAPANWSSKGVVEVLDNERRLPPKLQYYTDKHHFYPQHFTKKVVAFTNKRKSCTPSPSSNLS